MSETLPIVISIFGLIGLGYAAARVGLLAAPVGDALSEFAFRVAMPVLIFETLANADLQGLSPWRIWAAYFIPFALVWAAAHAMIRRVFGRDARAGVVAGAGAAYSNALLIGVPLMQAAFGDDGTVFAIVVITIHLPIMMLASVALHEWAQRLDGIAESPERRSESLRRVGISLATHPILLAILAGLLWRIAGVPLPAWLAAIADPIGRAAGPLALFASGMALVNFGMARQIAPAFAIAALKLAVLPALVYGAARLAGLPPLGVAALTLTAACPTGVNVFIAAGRLGTGQALASNVLLISTAGGVLTITLWLTLMQAMLA